MPKKPQQAGCETKAHHLNPSHNGAQPAVGIVYWLNSCKTSISALTPTTAYSTVVPCGRILQLRRSACTIAEWGGGLSCDYCKLSFTYMQRYSTGILDCPVALPLRNYYYKIIPCSRYLQGKGCVGALQACSATGHPSEYSGTFKIMKQGTQPERFMGNTEEIKVYVLPKV